jgi:ribosome-associated protein
VTAEPDGGLLRVDERTAIPESELHFAASRSGGPGGQHVNKVATRVSLRFDVEGSPSLDPEQKRRIAARLRTRITKEGVLHMHSSASRSQAANRRDLVERFVAVLREALRPRKPRRKTKPTRASRERRLETKKLRARLKRDRKGTSP